MTAGVPQGSILRLALRRYAVTEVPWRIDSGMDVG